MYPLGIMWLCFDRYLRNEDTDKPVDEGSLIRFYDEYKKLRLVIANEAVVFVKSEENYVQIHYQDRFDSIPISRKYQDVIMKLL